MPLIVFLDVTGVMKVNYLESKIDINVFMNGNSILDDQSFIVNIEKEQRDLVYRAYLFSP
jgi:hypothetical protein